ncbi:MAG TPA: two-component regulator propeller domain-containing protein, partial [Verrucomicrobiae bacterium]|nr:two-component regulator propeller domain-containing protein [Verrucomicrobiae bacterium]
MLFVATGALAKPSDFLVDLWTSDNDLPDSSVTAITQTPDGYLWIGTYNGLARFDGVRFTTFDPANTPELKNPRIFGLFTDPRGTLWISTFDGSVTSYRDGVFKYEWQCGQIVSAFFPSNRTYLATLGRGVAVGINNGQSNLWQTLNEDPPSASSFCQDASGTIWCLLRDGRIKWISGTNVLSLPDNAGLGTEKVNCITADQSGRIWIGTSKWIAHWNGDHFEDATPTNSETVTNVSFLYCSSTNDFWAFVNDSVRHAVNGRWVTNAASWRDLLQTSPIYIGAYQEQNGDVWFRNYGQGLFHAGTDGTLERISSATGLPGDRVSAWFQDREGNLWVGVDRGGLVRLRKKLFHVIGLDDNFAVSTICEDSRNNVWIGTFENGLNR